MANGILRGDRLPINVGYVNKPRWTADHTQSAYFDLKKDTQFKVVTRKIDDIREEYRNRKPL